MSKLSQILSVFAPRPFDQQLGMKKPKSLKLNFRNIAEIDALKAGQLEVYKHIEELSLNHNKLADLGCLAQFTDLRKLSLTNNPLQDPVQKLVEAYQRAPDSARYLQEINVSGSAFLSQSELDMLKRLFPCLAKFNGESVDEQEQPAQSGRMQEDPDRKSSSASSNVSKDWMKQSGIVSVGEVMRRSQANTFWSPPSGSKQHKKSLGSSPGVDSKNLSSKYKSQI